MAGAEMRKVRTVNAGQQRRSVRRILCHNLHTQPTVILRKRSVRTYKAAVTMLCRREGHTNFRWQRSYYEHVMRDDVELNRTRQYISDNPANWNQDEHHAR